MAVDFTPVTGSVRAFLNVRRIRTVSIASSDGSLGGAKTKISGGGNDFPPKSGSSCGRISVTPVGKSIRSGAVSNDRSDVSVKREDYFSRQA